MGFNIKVDSYFYVAIRRGRSALDTSSSYELLNNVFLWDSSKEKSCLKMAMLFNLFFLLVIKK